MAIIKHLTSRNSRYEDALNYLEYEHDEKGKLIKDINGEPIKREGMIIDSINCNVATFDLECYEINQKYQKNQTKEEIKQHHYVISFDPRDAVDNGLTAEDVQSFGMEFAQKYIPGYQTLVSTHIDGHNGSGNLHCHIVINSIRIKDVEREAYMDQPMDNFAGGKHRATPEYMDYLKTRVMEMCQERGLYQANLLEPAAERITDREYHTKQKGMALEGASFQTKKEYLRDAIKYSAMRSDGINEFKMIMSEEFNVRVKESRGRFSYILPDRERGITDRQLGASFTMRFITKVINKEEMFKATEPKTEYYSAAYIPASVRKLVDIANNEKAKASKGYEYVLVLSNLKQSANTINLLSEMGVKGQKDLMLAIGNVSAQLNKISQEVKQLEKMISEMENIMTWKEDIERIRPIIKELKTGKSSAAFRSKHESDLIIYKAAKTKLAGAEAAIKEMPPEKMRAEIASLREKKNDLYEQRSKAKKDLTDLRNAKYNIEKLTGREKTKERSEPVL